MRADRLAWFGAHRRTIDPDAMSREAERLERLSDLRLASGPGLVAAAFGIDRSWTGHRPLDPSSPLRLEGPVRDRRRRRRRDRPADRRRLRGRAVGGPAVAVRHRRRPLGLRPARPAAEPDGPALDRAPRVPARPGAAGRGDLVPALAPTRRGPRAIRRPGDRRARARRDRPGPRAPHRAPGRRDRRRARHRPLDRARRARRAPGARPVPRAGRDARCHRPARHRPRRRTTGAASRARGRPAPAARAARARSPAASTRSASCWTPPRRGWAGCARRSASPTTGSAAGSTRWSARSSAARSRSRSSRCATAATWCRSRPRRGRRVKGIVHDASGSGQTLFIEPLVAVELGNAWREAQVAEAEEVARILDELSAFVAANAGPLRETLDALARFDFWAAKASLAAELDGVRAETDDRPRRGGRDPAVGAAPGPQRPGRAHRHPPRRRGTRALVVTGPNTGGKTVTLRTLGLLSLMHQSGLHVPAAAGSRLPIWRDVFADIGDEQSIAQSLSTFSGHLRSIIRIVEAAGPGTLVLLDELGAGTDPTEGSALAQALLDHFMPGRRDRRGDDPLRRAQGLRPYDRGRPQRRGRVRPRDAEPDVPADDRAARRAARRSRSPSGSACPTEIVADARSRLSEAQRSFEATLAAIKATEGETGEALDRARAAELRAAEALRVGGRGAAAGTARAGRGDAGGARRGGAARRAAARRRSATRAGRSSARRVTAPSLDSAVDRAEAIARAAPRRRGRGRSGPRSRGPAHVAGRRARPERVGRLGGPDRGPGARRPAGDPGGRRDAGHGRRRPTSSWRTGRGRGGRTRVVGGIRPGPRTPAPCASSAPARSPRRSTCAAPGSTRRSRRWRATSTTRRWPGLRQGRRSSTGSARARCAMRSAAAGGHPLVQSVRPGERGEGGDGATIVELWLERPRRLGAPSVGFGGPACSASAPAGQPSGRSGGRRGEPGSQVAAAVAARRRRDSGHCSARTARPTSGRTGGSRRRRSRRSGCPSRPPRDARAPCRARGPAAVGLLPGREVGVDLGEVEEAAGHLGADAAVLPEQAVAASIVPARSGPSRVLRRDRCSGGRTP